ncbi:MAG: hypothetical protein ACN2B6_09870 [Rickettsiales bacterium]
MERRNLDDPVITEKLIGKILEDQQEFLKNPEKRAMVLQQGQAFYEDTKQWRVHRSDPNHEPDHNPIIDEQTRRVLLRGFYKLVISFDKARLKNADTSFRYDVDTADISAEIKKNLLQCDCVKQYQGNQDAAAMRLLGSTIRRAVDTAKSIGIYAPSILHNRVILAGTEDRSSPAAER